MSETPTSSSARWCGLMCATTLCAMAEWILWWLDQWAASAATCTPWCAKCSRSRGPAPRAPPEAFDRALLARARDDRSRDHARHECRGAKRIAARLDLPPALRRDQSLHARRAERDP